MRPDEKAIGLVTLTTNLTTRDVDSIFFQNERIRALQIPGVTIEPGGRLGKRIYSFRLIDNKYGVSYQPFQLTSRGKIQFYPYSKDYDSFRDNLVRYLGIYCGHDVAVAGEVFKPYHSERVRKNDVPLHGMLTTAEVWNAIHSEGEFSPAGRMIRATLLPAYGEQVGQEEEKALRGYLTWCLKGDALRDLTFKILLRMLDQGHILAVRRYLRTVALTLCDGHKARLFDLAYAQVQFRDWLSNLSLEELQGYAEANGKFRHELSRNAKDLLDITKRGLATQTEIFYGILNG